MSTANSSLRGVFVIMQTPFNEQLEIDDASLIREVELLVQARVHGLVWPAAASEILTLSREERLRCAALIVESTANRLPVVIGVTSGSRAEAALYTRHAKDIGAAATLTLPPTDHRPPDAGMFTEYLSAIADSSDLPIVVQTSYPGQPSGLAPAYLIQLAEKLTMFKYVKEEQVGIGSLPWRVSYYQKYSKGLLSVFCGAGARNLLNEMARGSCGTMPGAGFAEIQVAIWNLFHQGQYSEARELFARMLTMAVLEQSVGYVLQKEILRRRGVFQTTLMRHSRQVQMDKHDQSELDGIFQLLYPWLDGRRGTSWTGCPA